MGGLYRRRISIYDMRKKPQEKGVEANSEEEEVKEGDDDMGRYGRRDKVGRFVGQGGGDGGGNDKKVRENILSTPPPLCVHCIVIYEGDRIGIGIRIRIGIGGVGGIQ